MTENLFENASRYDYRYDSSRGLLTTAQLWDLPLKSGNGFDLDTIAKGLNAELKAMAEESFVDKSVPDKTYTEQRFEIVKHIIRVRLDENAKKADALVRKDQIKKIEAIIAKKQDGALEDMSPEALLLQLAALKSA